ncbi:MAG: FtsX-like permease family protein [Pseudomonadales bacterium]
MTMPISLLLSLSTRNLFRHRRRNLMLLAAICVAVAGVTVMNSLIRGFQEDMRESAVANLTGDIKVLAPGYRDDPGIEKRFELARQWDPAQLSAELAGWAPRVRVPAVIMSERETRGVQLVGVDPAREDISFLGDVPVAGERLGGADDNRLLLGVALAEQLQTGLGYRLVIITQGADGRNREAGFRVAGLFDAEGTGLEKAFAFTGLGFLQGLLDADGVTELSIRLRSSETAAEERSLAGRLRDLFTGQDVLRWQELEPQAAAMFAFADMAVFIWFLIMMGALVFGLVNTLVTAVMERTREFGMLRAVGMRRSTVVIQVVIESTLIMLAGVVVGLALGSGFVLWLDEGIDLSQWAEGMEMAGMSAILVPRLLAGDLMLVAGMSLALGVAASLYPAWRAVKIEPLEALRR